LAPDSEEPRRYIEIPEEDWDEQTVLELLSSDPQEYYCNLSSIMYSVGNDDDWKVKLALSLLDKEKNQSLRSSIWSGLCIKARIAPVPSLTDAAERAWELIDMSSEGSDSIELETAQNFLDDMRIYFMSDENVDYAKLRDWALSKERFKSFIAIRTLSFFGPIQQAGQIITTLSKSEDFVIRKSVVDAVARIYVRIQGRNECIRESLGSLHTEFAKIIAEAEVDSHWYVSESADVAKFFEE